MKNLKTRLTIILAFFLQNVFCQKNVNGIILNSETNESIRGVNIQVKESKNLFITNDAGEFQINIKEFPVTLLISHIGFEAKTVVLGDEKDVQITLKTSVILLNEVVSGNIAIAILNNVIRKEVADTTTRFLYKAYYQRISSASGKYNKFHEMYLNISWNSLGVQKWIPLNVRYIETEKQTSLPQNMTFASFFHSATIHEQDNFPINYSDLTYNYNFKVLKYINIG